MPIKRHSRENKTNVDELRFKQDSSLSTALLQIPGYEINDELVMYNGIEVAKIGYEARLSEVFLHPYNFNFRDITSNEIKPDEAIYVYKSNTVYIIDKKFQNGAVSVEENLETCDYKKKRYQKLFRDLGYHVEFMYVLNNWFSQPGYDDIKEYVLDVGCHYYFNRIPLDTMGLPHNIGKEDNLK